MPDKQKESTLEAALRVNQIIKWMIHKQENVLQQLKRQNGDVDLLETKVRDLFFSIIRVWKMILSEKQEHILHFLTQPKISISIDTAKFAMEFSSRSSAVERAERMDIFTCLLAGIALIWGVERYIPDTFGAIKILIVVFIILFFIVFGKQIMKLLIGLYRLF